MNGALEYCRARASRMSAGALRGSLRDGGKQRDVGTLRRSLRCTKRNMLYCVLYGPGFFERSDMLILCSR